MYNRLISSTLALLFLSLAALPAPAAERPNIIVMMVDDMGFSDFGCYGSEIRTPNIDALAAGGLRFTQFYNTGRCCPTRASLLTGLYPHQAGVGHMTNDRGHDGYRGDLNRRCVTIAEVLGSAGYGTYMVGKWHVTKNMTARSDEDKHNWPRQRGFDRYFGTITGAGSFFTPKTLTRDNTPVTKFPKGFFYSDAINDTAGEFITEHVKRTPDKPFFCYVAHTAPHWPLHAKPQDIERYVGKYSKGWDVVRAERHKRQIKMGLVKSQWKITARDSKAKAWDELDAKRQENMDRRMAIYAAQIDTVDQGVGRLVETLKKLGQFDNTLILLLADNGGCAEGGIWGFDRNKTGKLGSDESFSSYGLSWANASNTPFREYKHWVHEGGISTPLIAHWPAKIKDAGKLRHQPGHLIDIMATCVDVSGAKYPTKYKGHKIKPREGKSLLPAFENKPIDREAIYWEHEGNRAVRVGQWKLVAKGARGPWELYDLEADRTETNNLAEKEPRRTRRMAKLWQLWAERANVLPLNPRRAKKTSKTKSPKK